MKMSQALLDAAEAACAVVRELTALFVARDFDTEIPEAL